MNVLIVDDHALFRDATSLLMFGTGGIYAWYHSRKLTD